MYTELNKWKKKRQLLPLGKQKSVLENKHKYNIKFGSAVHNAYKAIRM